MHNSINFDYKRYQLHFFFPMNFRDHQLNGTVAGLLSWCICVTGSESKYGFTIPWKLRIILDVVVTCLSHLGCLIIVGNSTCFSNSLLSLCVYVNPWKKRGSVGMILNNVNPCVYVNPWIALLITIIQVCPAMHESLLFLKSFRMHSCYLTIL